VFKVRNLQDLLAGLVFALFGVAGLYFGRDYAIGVTSRMGPGYLPWVLSIGLIVLGAIIAARGLMTDGQPLEPSHWRPLVFIIGAIIVFGFLIERAGLVVSGFLVTVLCALGYRDRIRPVEILVMAVVLTIFCVVLFIELLGQQMPVWWWG
jgi:hypothetical protein